MKKYGDMMFFRAEDVNLVLKEGIDKAVLNNQSSFNDIFMTISKLDELEDVPYITYNNATILSSFEIDPIYEKQTFLSGEELVIKIWEKDINIFWKNIELYTKNTILYANDVRLSVGYNLSIESRCEQNTITDRCDDIKDLAAEGECEYILPFDLSGNKFNDFCAYTWKAMFKDSDSIECFKKSKKGRVYVNGRCFGNIMKAITCKAQDVTLSENDKWLIEKVLGTSTVLSLFPLVADYYDKKTCETIYFPLLKILMGCRPVNIRMALADLVCIYLKSVPYLDKKSPYWNASNNNLYDLKMIEKLLEKLKKVIDEINKNYQTMLKAFYDSIKIGKVEFYFTDFLSFELWVPKAPEDQRIGKKKKEELQIDETAPYILFNRIGLMKMKQKLINYPRKRTYNNGDPQWRFAILQSEAIKRSYEIYHSVV